MADEKQFPQPQVQPQQQAVHPQPARVGLSGVTQVVTASIGAIATISGALIAANWGRGRPDPVVHATPTTISSPANFGTNDPVFPRTDPTDDPEPEVTDLPPGMLSIAGDWRGGQSGNPTRILQNAAGQFQITTESPSPNGTITAVGRGRMAGNMMSWDYRTDAGEAGSCTAQVSEEANRIQGTCQTNGMVGPMFIVR